MLYDIQITEVNKGTIYSLYAESEEEARQIASDQAKAGQVVYSRTVHSFKVSQKD